MTILRLHSRAIGVALFLVAACAAPAQDSIGKFEASGSAAVFNALGDSGFTKPAYGAAFAGRVKENGQLYGEFMFTPLGTQRLYAGGWYSSSTARLYNITAGYRYHFKEVAKNLRPFISGFGGIGVATVSGKTSFLGGGISVSDTVNAGIWGVGGGVRYKVGKTWGVRPEVRFQRYETRHTGGDNSLLFMISVYKEFGK